MPKKNERIVLQRQCMDCGRDILVLIDRKTRKMLSEDWYYGKHRFGIGEWGYSRMVTNPDGSIKWVRLNPRWKELWYRLIDLKRTILHQYDDVEMWVCRECVLSEYGTTIQERSKNPSKRYEERVKVLKQRIHKKRKK